MSVPVIYRLESVKIYEHQRKKSAVITYVYYGFKLFSKLPAVRQTRELIHSCKYLQLPIFELKLLSSFYYFFLKHLVELSVFFCQVLIYEVGVHESGYYISEYHKHRKKRKSHDIVITENHCSEKKYLHCDGRVLPLMIAGRSIFILCYFRKFIFYPVIQAVAYHEEGSHPEYINIA